MSRYSQYNKNETYRDNFKYANLQKERRVNENLQEIERDRIAMERLKIELDQEKKLEIERKNQIKQQQYEDYSNYMRQKYAENPQNRENINIKLGSEQRYIRKSNYNQQMDNLCLNPTKQEKKYPPMPYYNFSKAGRNYHRDNSHGYNILTGEIYSQGQVGNQTPQISNNNKNNIDNEGYIEPPEKVPKTEYPKDINPNRDINFAHKEKEDLSQYQAYMAMKRQKEQNEAMYYLNQQREKEKDLENNQIEQPQNNYNDIKQKENYEHMNLNQNKEIPPEYRDIYMRQQIEQQQKYNNYPENKGMYLQDQNEQEKKQLERQNNQEMPPEYKKMLLRKQMEQEQQELERQQRQELPPEYKEFLLKKQMEKEQQQTFESQYQKDNPPLQENRELEQYMKDPNQYQHQPVYNPQEEKNKIIPQVSSQQLLENNEELPDEYKEIMQQQKYQKHGRSTPYTVKNNNYLEQNQNYNHNNNFNQEKNDNLQEKLTDKELKSYISAQEKEKEDENMEIYKNMLREKEKEKEKEKQMENEKELQNNKNREREEYYQYLLNQQNKNTNQNIYQNQENSENNQNQFQYPDIIEKNENKAPSQTININETNDKPINSFEEYYKQKGININEQQQILNQDIKEGQYENNMPQSQGQDFNEQDYLMYQQQQQKNIGEYEEREGNNNIMEKQQLEKMNMNNMKDNNIENYYPQEQSSLYNSPYYNSEMTISERKSEFNSAKMEYLQNKQKNMTSRDNIFSALEIPKPPPKYNNEPFTKADRLRIQREYAQFLEAQINAKNIKNNKNRNNGLNQLPKTAYDFGGPNPYQQLREKYNKLKDIPQDPYSVKNYNISNNSYLSSNPITNPVNSYKFVDRRKVSSGRLQNSGNNVIKK